VHQERYHQSHLLDQKMGRHGFLDEDVNRSIRLIMGGLDVGWLDSLFRVAQRALALGSTR